MVERQKRLVANAENAAKEANNAASGSSRPYSAIANTPGITIAARAAFRRLMEMGSWSTGGSCAVPSTRRCHDGPARPSEGSGILHFEVVPTAPETAPATPRRFYLRTYGCQMNEHDSERIAGLLVAEGMEPTDELEAADVVVLNTCCIRENADNKLYGHLGRLKALKAERPDLQIAVGGCLAQKDRELIVERAGHVDVVFGTHNLAHAPALLAQARTEGPVVEILEEHGAYPSALPARRDTAHSAWVTIQVGCDNSCTFCIVPIVRGAEVSRRMGDIVHEVEQLVADGVREITLLGQNVNSYGRDLGAGQYRPQFADLLRALDAADGLSRIRFTSPHPKDLRPDTIAAMAECASVCEHLHLPLQSGSDRTLARMHRGYTADRYLTRLRAARARGRRPRGHHRHHRGLSRRDRGGLRRARWKSSTPRSTTPRTPSSSRHGPVRRPPR